MEIEEYIARAFHDTFRKLRKKFAWKETDSVVGVDWDELPKSERILLTETVRILIQNKVIKSVVEKPEVFRDGLLDYIDLLWKEGVRNAMDMSAYILNRYPDIDEREAQLAYAYWKQYKV